MTNEAIARVFNDLADWLELDGGQDFRARAFRNAADAIGLLRESAEARARAGTLSEIPGIGEGIVRRVIELCDTGTLAELDPSEHQVPQRLIELTQIPSCGPKTAAKLWRRLGVETIAQLEEAIAARQLRLLPGFGAKREAKLAESIAAYRLAHARMPLATALAQGVAIAGDLRQVPGARRVELCGSARRLCDTVGDLDILVAGSREVGVRVSARLTERDDVAAVIAHTDTMASVRLRSGTQVDLRVVPRRTWGAALYYFTGSKAHNIAVRTMALHKGLKISDQGIFTSKGEWVGGTEEHEVLAAVGLPWIPPELRENRGEIEAALAGRLPTLIELSDLRGDLHAHTSASDGRSTLRAMALAARAAGREYIAITDHGRPGGQGLGEAALDEQRRQIDAMNDELAGRPQVLAGVEVDIRRDGSLAIDPAALAPLDWVVASVHSSFDLPREEQTRRVIAALQTGVVDCLGHPRARRLSGRPPIDIDLERVFRAAIDAGSAVEIDGSPDRLDLDEHGARLAKEMGVPIVIVSDAHDTLELGNIRYGVAVARRGWLEAKDVVNARPVREVLHRFSVHHPRVRRAG